MAQITDDGVAPPTPEDEPSTSVPATAGRDDVQVSVDAGQPLWQRISKRLLGYAALVTFALVFISPFILALANSLKTRPQAANEGLTLVPDPLTTGAYQRLASQGFWRAVFVSVVVTVLVTAGRVFLDSLAGYALARLRFPGRRLVFATVVATLAIPPIVLAIPRFLVLGQLGLLNTWGGLVLPLAVDAFGIFLMRQFFLTVPTEVEEAAKLDGATVFQTFSRIILPLATPALIALTILSFQGSWNEFLHPLIAAPGRADLNTVPVFLALATGSVGQARDFPFELAGSMLSTIPVAIVFFSFQRHFVQGVAASGIKG